MLWVFEVLPFLEKQGQRPQWRIRSRLYGRGPDQVVLPGVFDLAYEPAPGPSQPQSLLALRSQRLSALGNDWQGLHDLWHRFFKVPDRIHARADAIGLPSGTLGVHYRGTDKNLALQDTNTVTPQDMLDAAAEALSRYPHLQCIFLATDEVEIVALARARFAPLTVVNLGGVSYHKSGVADEDRADRALLDCVLLSRCAVVLKCSSALSGFAKILRPELPVFRVAASKFFYDVPYFPDAYVPRWEATTPEGQRRSQRLFDGDWLDDRRVPRRFRRDFMVQPRYRWLQRWARRLHFLLSA
ncbi:MAG: hypothetical protein C4K60_19650 [Ideonella sp. MAG2]|nr:MAG: hypothetical protein C4K60_19650 [Ideonella sp. MAG2]